MTRLAWGSSGQRFYEAGADRGVLYPKGLSGVAWGGLISVDESPTGGEATPYYYDGVKYANVATSEEFEATIKAFSSPPEFAACDGTAAIQNGLFITQQPRKPFDFSYRTLVGNDEDALEHGYKIHLVYNALAAPSQRSQATLSSSVEVMQLSWAITTLAPAIRDYRPSAHLIVDSRYASEQTMRELEDSLYGTDTSAPHIPTAQELSDIFTNYMPLVVVDLGNGHYTASGTDVDIHQPGIFTIEHERVIKYPNGTFRITD